MSLTFDQQLADVPKQAADIPFTHLDDNSLQGIVCKEGKKINTTGVETAYTLQTPLNDYIVFTNQSVDWGASYFKNTTGRLRQWVRAPNSSFLEARGAVALAVMKPSYYTYSLNRFYFSSTAQIVIEVIIDPFNYISRNVSNLTCALPTTPASTQPSTTLPASLPASTPLPVLLEIPTAEPSHNTGLILGLSAAGVVLLLAAVFAYHYCFAREYKTTKVFTYRRIQAY
jgi:hypothetical protein